MVFQAIQHLLQISLQHLQLALPNPVQFFANEPAAIALVGVGVALSLMLVLASTRSKTPDTAEGAIRVPHRLPSTLPIVGNLVGIVQNAHRRHDWLTEYCEKYNGEAFTLAIPGQPPLVLLSTPRAVEDCLKIQFENTPKGPTQTDLLRDLLGHGIFAVGGGKWVHQRNTASNLFTARALRDTMTESMRRYTVVLERILDKARQSGETIDVFKLMNKFTIEAFAKMGLGIDMNALEAVEDHPFQRAFDSAQRMLLFRFFRPTWFWKLQRILNIGPERQLKRDIAAIDDTAMKIVADSLAKHQQQGPNKSESNSADIVSLFLDRFDDSAGEQFDPTYLRDIVVNFLIAGRDTTAQAMSWCFYNLSQKPEIMAKIRQEIAHVLPEFANGQRTEAPTMDEVQQLTYPDATLKETLRLHPSVPALPKSIVKDTVLTDGTSLAAGTNVSMLTYAMGRMEFVWGPDAKQFKPERWIDPVTGKIRNESTFKFASFNAGPRICLGMNLAMLEMKIVMASVLTRFNIELLDPQKVTYDDSLTLPVRGEMLARVTRA